MTNPGMFSWSTSSIMFLKLHSVDDNSIIRVNANYIRNYSDYEYDGKKCCAITFALNEEQIIVTETSDDIDKAISGDNK